MTYLLTEVALGMLGHDFYDINGVPGSPCLSENTNTVEDYSDKPHLTTLIKLDKEQAELSENNSESLTESVEESNDSPAVISLGSKLYSTQTKGLHKLLNNERRRLREQIRRNKTNHMFTYAFKNDNPKAQMSKFLTDEMERLVREYRILNDFRKHTERNVSVLDNEIFGKYLDTFKRACEEVGSDTNNIMFD